MKHDFEDKKYTVVFEDDGSCYALRHGEQWRDLTGDKLVGAMLSEVDKLRTALQAVANIENKLHGGDWDEIDEAREIAHTALK